jgi:hypothetical protein
VSRAQHILAVIVGLITGVLLMEPYSAMVTAARAGGRAIPELWPLGTEALALAMEVSVLEAKRLHHRAVLRLSWLLLVASVALSTLLQVAVAPATLVGYLTAGATPVWLLGSFAVLSLLYRAEASAEQAPASAAVAPSSAQTSLTGAAVLTKRARAERAWVELSATRALGSWPPRLGSAPATPAPWSPSSRPDPRPPSSTTAATPPRVPPTRTRRPPYDRHAAGRPRRRQPPGRRPEHAWTATTPTSSRVVEAASGCRCRQARAGPTCPPQRVRRNGCSPRLPGAG